jgi:O-antigen/teichoic acid export membrane protein
VRSKLLPVFERVRRPWLIGSGWVLAGLCGGGQAAVDRLWDERYAAAGGITQLLSIGAWFGILEMTNGAAVLARGRVKWLAAGNAIKLAGMIVLIPVGFRLDGFRGAVLGLVASELIRYLVSAYALIRMGMRAGPQDLRLTLWVLATAWIGWQTALFGERAHWLAVVVAGAVFVSVTLAWAPLGASVYRGFRRRHP